MKYSIDENEDGLAISIDNEKDKKEMLLQAFRECQEGRCSCPTEAYRKLASLEIDHNDETIEIRLKPKQGEKISKEEIGKCLEYTSGGVGDSV